MDPITPLTKQELENRGWQMTTVENPTPDPGPTVVQQMRLEFATIKAYKGSEGYSRTLRFKLFGVAEEDLPNIRLEFGRFIKTRHTESAGLADKGAAPSLEYSQGGHYICKGFIVPNPRRRVAVFNDGAHYMGNAEGSPFNVPTEGSLPFHNPGSWRKPFQLPGDKVCLIGRTKLQASNVNPNEYVAVDPNPDANIPYVDSNPQGTILTLTDFIVPFVALYQSAAAGGVRTFAAGHRCGTVTTAKIQSGSQSTEANLALVSLRFVKCGFRIVNVVTGETSPILEFVPTVTLFHTGIEWGVAAHVSYGSYNPKRHSTANSVGQ